MCVGGGESVGRGKLIDIVWLPSATVSLSCFGGGGVFGSGFSSARLCGGLVCQQHVIITDRTRDLFPPLYLKSFHMSDIRLILQLSR